MSGRSNFQYDIPSSSSVQFRSEFHTDLVAMRTTGLTAICHHDPARDCGSGAWFLRLPAPRHGSLRSFAGDGDSDESPADLGKGRKEPFPAWRSAYGRTGTVTGPSWICAALRPAGPTRRRNSGASRIKLGPQCIDAAVGERHPPMATLHN